MIRQSYNSKHTLELKLAHTVYLNYPRPLGCVSTASPTKMKVIFYYTVCDRYKDISQHVTKDILTKYSTYDFLNDNDNIVFLFNNVDTYIENIS